MKSLFSFKNAALLGLSALTAAIIYGCGSGSSNNNSGVFEITPTPNSIFVTPSRVDGKMAVEGTYKDWQSIHGGIAGADEVCDHEAESIFGDNDFVWKALITDGRNRVPKGNDWALKPNTAYINAISRARIGTTTDEKIFQFDLTGAFDAGQFSLIPDYYPQPTTSIREIIIYNIWTGLNTDWSHDPRYLCNKNNTVDPWTDASNSIGITGHSSTITNEYNGIYNARWFESPVLTVQSVSNEIKSCSQIGINQYDPQGNTIKEGRHLICVAQ